MKYDFDKIINRKNTGSIKWDLDKEEVLPMWVADMDFKSPKPVIEALEKRVAHGVFGYGYISDSYYDAEILWWRKKYNFEIKKEWIEATTGVIPTIANVIQAFTNHGDKVLIQSPVYNYFNTSIINNKCKIILNELKYNNGKYEIDFEDFEKKVSEEGVKIFILCNPHNPIGIVWSEDDLKRMGEICLKYKILILVDEIHRDLVYKNKDYTPFISINEEFLTNSITCTAPSKTFNLAGLKVSNIIIANEEYRKKVNEILHKNEVPSPNIFAIDAMIAAYNEGDDWLNQLLNYLEDNRDYLINYINEKIPSLKVIKPDATYLVWIECKSLGISSKVFSKKLLKEGHLRVSFGSIYGLGGEGFIRINIACSRKLLKKGLEILEKVVNDLEKKRQK